MPYSYTYYIPCSLAVDVAKTLFQSATSWITAEDPESSTSTAHPLLRSAGVSAFQLPPELPEDSQEPSEAVLAPAEASVRSQSGFVAPEDGARGAVSINRTVSRRDSMQGSMARSMENAFSDLVAQPTDFAAAMETVLNHAYRKHILFFRTICVHSQPNLFRITSGITSVGRLFIWWLAETTHADCHSYFSGTAL